MKETMLSCLPLLLLLCCFMHVETSEVNEKCINSSEIGNRARLREFRCPHQKEYHYTWNPADGNFKEGCFITKMVPKGYMTVLDQRSNHINSVECPDETFQPTAYLSNTQCNCSFFKSKCDTTGSVIISNGSTYEDRICGCDYKRGFDFQHTPNNRCFCQPMHENCSCTCYSGNCETRTNLSHDETTMNTTQWVAVSCVIGIIIGFFLGFAVAKTTTVSTDQGLSENDRTLSHYNGANQPVYIVEDYGDQYSGTDDHSLSADQGLSENDRMLSHNNGANQFVCTGSIFEDYGDQYSGTDDYSLSDFASKSKQEQGGVQPLGPRHEDDDDNKA